MGGGAEPPKSLPYLRPWPAPQRPSKHNQKEFLSFNVGLKFKTPVSRTLLERTRKRREIYSDDDHTRRINTNQPKFDRFFRY